MQEQHGFDPGVPGGVCRLVLVTKVRALAALGFEVVEAPAAIY
jgi:hypothetical protein